MDRKIKSLETLSGLKGYYKKIAAKELDDLNLEVLDIEKKIISENNALNRFFEEIRNSRKTKAFLTSDSYEREFDHIKIIKEEIHRLEARLLELKEQKRTKKQQIVREMNKEKLYNTVANNKKHAIAMELNKKADNQLQEQWLSNNYKNE